MNAFGNRNGLGSGQRPQFGVARPMKGGPAPAGGEQFPPVEDLPEAAPPPDEDGMPGAPASPMAAMDRLNDRQNASDLQQVASPVICLVAIR